jgi:hypothetical protein
LNEPKRHHYNPEMLSARFTDEACNLHFFDKRAADRGVITSTPENVFVVGHLYSLIGKDGSKNTALEKYYAHVEGRANGLIEKIITAARAEKLPGLSNAEKAEWDAYVYQQWSRVPDLHLRTLNDFEDTLRRSVEEFEKTVRPLTDAERLSLKEPETLARIKQNARVMSLGIDHGPAVDALGTRGLGVAIIKRRNKSFVLGSLPVVKLTLPSRTHITDPTVEAWLPIASDVAVSPAGTRGTEQLFPITDDRYIRALNEATFGQSTVIAGCSHALIASLSGTR